MKKITLSALAVIAALTLQSCGNKVSPEMNDFLDSFGDKQTFKAAVQKYGKEGVVPKNVTKCLLDHPEVKNIAQKDGIVYYTVVSRVTNCNCAAKDKIEGSHRIFILGWQDGKIVSFQWKGTKKGDEHKHFG